VGQQPGRLDVLVPGDGETARRQREPQGHGVGAQEALVEPGGLRDLAEGVAAASSQGQLRGKDDEPVVGDGLAQLLERRALPGQLLEQRAAGDPRLPGDTVEEAGGLPLARSLGLLARTGLRAQQ